MPVTKQQFAYNLAKEILSFVYVRPLVLRRRFTADNAFALLESHGSQRCRA